MTTARFTKGELALLLFYVFCFAGLLVLIITNGPNVLLAVGTAGMAIGQIGKAFTRPAARPAAE